MSRAGRTSADGARVTSRRVAPLAYVACAAAGCWLGGAPAPAFAANVVSTYNRPPDSGIVDWQNNGHWTNVPAQGGYPNNGNFGLTYDAVINNGGTAIIQGGQVITVQKLTMGSGGGFIFGSTTLNVNELLTWTAGSIGVDFLNARGGILFNRPVRVATSGPHNLNVFGVTNWTGAAITFPRFNLQPGATFNIGTADGVFFGDSSTTYGTFANSGTINKNSAGLTPFNTRLDNAGTVNISAGEMRFNGGGTQTGTFNSAGRQISFGGPHDFRPGSTVIADPVRFIGFDPITLGGTLNTSNVILDTTGSVAFNSSLTLTSLSHLRGTLDGSGTVTVANPITWTQQGYGGNGTFNANAGFDIRGGFGGGASKHIRGTRVINNGGVTTFGGDGSIAFEGGAVFNNLAGARFDVTAGNNAGFVPASFNSAGTFNNAGTLNKQSGGITPFTAFNNSGTVNVQAGTLRFTGAYTQTAGTLALTGGQVAATAAFNLQGGRLTGAGTVTANVNNTGAAIAPGQSAGVLGVTGNLTLGGGSVLELGIGGAAPGTQYDRLNVTGAAALGGGVRVELTDAFTPAWGDRFDVMTWGSRTGRFAAHQAPNTPPGFALAPEYAADRMTLTYARYGDANLDRAVNGSDFAILAGNFGRAATEWGQGDFNLDGFVNGTDFALLAGNFGNAASGAAGSVSASEWTALESFGAGIGVAVPEPSAAGAVIAALGGLALRRRLAPRTHRRQVKDQR